MSDFEGPALLENDALVDVSDTRGGYPTTLGTFRVQVSEICTSVDDKMDKSFLGESSSCKEKRMSNGDIYVGSWKSGLPDGLGKYLWLDGCMYEGDWVSGKATGRGKISWPSGATYEGEFSGGFIQGVGTLIGVSNTTYKGSWVMNVAHGLGRKWYSNGDVYEGLWKQGVQDGPGRYTWRNGDVYFGDWKKGLISGYGSLTWANRDSYHGHWLNGLKHGQGTYVWADGSCYMGTWSTGLKDGKGIFYPPGMRPSRHLSFSSYGGRRPNEETENYEPVSTGENQRIPFSYNSRWKSLERTALYPLKSMPSQHSVLQRRWSLEGPVEGLQLDKGVHNRVDEGHSADNDAQVEGNTLPILEREYAQGVLISELVKDSSDVTTIRSALHWQQTEPMDFKRLGETIIKGHRSYDLMLNLQLGIRYSVGRSIQGPECDLEPDHFSWKARLHVNFPSKGSQLTPPHHSVDFRWTDYCPVVFRKIRKMFKIEVADYIISICGSDALRELSSPGKSGSVFYLSNDDRYMIKTLQRSEVRVLLKMLPNYYKHICKHDNTLITKFFGLHQVTPRGGQKIRVVVMGNIFCTELRIHRRFDLKGSWQGRSTDKFEIDETTVLKDLDLDFAFYLEPSWRQALFEQIHKDCSFLESQHIMDYSLLLGLHFRAPPVSKSAKFQALDQESSIRQHNAMPSIQEDQIYPNGMALVAHDYKEESLLGPHVRGSPLRAATAGHEELDLMILGTNSRLQVQLGVNMPAKASRKLQTAAEGYGDDFLEVYDVILYFGVIDILQKYTVAKRVEHVYKSLKFHSDSISAVNPQLYSQRFQNFIHKIFTSHF